MFKFTHAITQELMDTIATYMDDEIREQVHAEIAPCEPEEFLRRYLELDPEFLELLENMEISNELDVVTALILQKKNL